MQFDHAFERVELRVFVNEHCVESFRRGCHERICERNLVRRLQLGRLIAQSIVRMVPSDRKLSDGCADPRGLLLAAIIRQDIPHLREGDKGRVEFNLSPFAGFEQTLYSLKTRLPVSQRDERRSIEHE